MEEKLKQILDYQSGRLFHYQLEIDEINASMKFMSEHKFMRELSALADKKQAMIDLFVDYKKSTEDLTELLTAWLS